VARDGELVRLGVDIGGTFTDAALEVGERRFTHKVLTDTAEPEKGVLRAVAETLGVAGLSAGEIDLIVHGTTLATNALIERRGAKTALVTTDGFRDVLEMRAENRYEQYDLSIELPPPLVPRRRRFTIGERMDSRGDVLVPLDEAAIRDLAPRLGQERCEAVAVTFLHSYANPAHERRAAEILTECLADVPISLSSEVSPEMGEYERLSTTCANAYVQPLISRYLARLERALREDEYQGPLLLMLSGGGLTSIETARRFPVRLIESGPAGGAMYACDVARACSLDSVLSFDMGGTTAKLCLIDRYQAQTSRRFEAARVYRFKKGSGLPLRIPVLEMVEIGAGGGSKGRVDRLDNIVVGPESAGSDPGPACYGRGGADATVTDADLVLGKIDAGRFSGGDIHLSKEKAEAALDHGIGTRLALSPVFAAHGICEVVDENMAGAARIHAIESGVSISNRTMIAFGGAAPLHAGRLADRLGIDRFIVPVSAGVGSAIGFLRAPVAYEMVRSGYQRFDSIDVDGVNAMLSDMSTEAREIIAPAVFGAALEETRSTFVRYTGQGHEIEIPIPARPLSPDDLDAVRSDFETRFRSIFNWTIAGAELEALSWKVLVTTAPAAPPESSLESATADAIPSGSTMVFDGDRGEMTRIDFFERSSLAAGNVVRGPAIIVEDETSTFVPAAFAARITSRGFIDCVRDGPTGEDMA